VVKKRGIENYVSIFRQIGHNFFTRAFLIW
jgi:hypothetical protein